MSNRRRLTAALVVVGAAAASAAAPPPAIVFRDVTATSGIDFRGPASAEKESILESVSGGVALLDFDGDGWLDVFLVGSSTVAAHEAGTAVGSPSALYRNRGDGTFVDVSRTVGLGDRGLGELGWGVGVCAGDVDGDGWVDLYVTGVERNHLLRNLAGAAVADVTAAAGVAGGGWSTGCGFADADRDGDLDLFVARYLDLRLDDLPAFGEGDICRYRDLPVQCGPRGLPGLSDLYFRNDGAGRFVEAASAAGLADPERRFGLGVAWLDVERDGWPDLYVANDTGANYLYKNRGDGTFEELGHLLGVAVSEDGKEQGSMGIAVGDAWNDGYPDLFVTHFADEHDTFYRNRGGEYFTDVSFAAGVAADSLPYVGWGTALADLDDDGWLDLVAVDGHVYPQVDRLEGENAPRYAQPGRLFHNRGDGTFAALPAGPLAAPRASRGLAAGDLDGDGRLDLVVTDLDAEARVLQNESPTSGHWLEVVLRDRRPSRDGEGAELELRASGVPQTRQVYGGGSYLSQHPLRQHFGLGDAGRVDALRVRWPDGAVRVYRGLPVDRVVVVAR